MRNLKSSKLFILALFTGSLIMFVGCQNENTINEDKMRVDLKTMSLESDSKTIETLLENLKPELLNLSKQTGEFEVITFEVVKNNDTNEIGIENVAISEFFPVFNKSEYQQARGNFQVDCDLGGPPNDWSEPCDSKWSCGGLIAECLAQGGCATICAKRSNKGNFSSVKVTFIPVVVSN